MRYGFPRTYARWWHNLHKRRLKRALGTFLTYPLQTRLCQPLHVMPRRRSKHDTILTVLDEIGHLRSTYSLPGGRAAHRKNGDVELSQESRYHRITLVNEGNNHGGSQIGGRMSMI